MIQGHGCDREMVGAMCAYIFSEGSTVYCNNSKDVLRSKTTAAMVGQGEIG